MAVVTSLGLMSGPCLLLGVDASAFSVSAVSMVTWGSALGVFLPGSVIGVHFLCPSLAHFLAGLCVFVVTVVRPWEFPCAWAEVVFLFVSDSARESC